jgi:hypothetical protein
VTATDSFFRWFYAGLNGLGGWFLFFVLAVAAVIWLFYDSSNRRLPAQGWRLGAILTAALLLPAIIFRFSGLETQDSLLPFVEWIFYFGLLGGVIPPVLAVGYYVSFRDLVGCREGHVYEASLGSNCPECARLAAAAAPVGGRYVAPPPSPLPAPVVPQAGPAPAPAAPKAPAWLVADTGRQYQLNAGDTLIGRGSQNDIRLTGDTSVSRQHAKIVMDTNGRFRLYDLGSTAGTRLNGRLLRQPELLEPDDEIQLGDGARLRFITSGR